MKKINKPITLDRLQVVGYCRVSSVEQAEEGCSIEAQKDKIQQWADLHEAEILDVYQDAGISGTKANRPGLLSAMETACQKRAVFVVYSLSRFSRSTSDTLRLTSQLQKAGAELVSVSEQIDTISAAGKMVFRILAVLNEFETELGGERTKAALDWRKRQGLKTGGYVPYGYTADKDGKLTKNPAEQRIIQRILRMHSGGKRYAAIARYLNDHEIPSKTGKQWYIQTVKNVISSNN